MLHLTQWLIGLNVILAGLLAALWVDPQGALKNVRWVAPPPVIVDLGKLPAELQDPNDADVSQFLATLERPLFSPSRRPPPPPPPPAPPPPPDPFANIQLYGVFSGPEASGIMARVDGKVRRIRVNEGVGAWTVKSVDDRDVTFVSGDATRVLRLVRVRTPVAPSAAPPAGGDSASAPAATVPAGASAQQQVQDEQRERVRRLNELRAKAGLPPLNY